MDIGISGLEYRPSSSSCQPPDIIDDLYICALYTKIDGRGTILGSAGPMEIRLIDSLPIIGEMKFDYDDIYNLQKKNNFQNVILHEMGHILGTYVWLCQVFAKHMFSKHISYGLTFSHPSLLSYLITQNNKSIHQQQQNRYR